MTTEIIIKTDNQEIKLNVSKIVQVNTDTKNFLYFDKVEGQESYRLTFTKGMLGIIESSNKKEIKV